MKIVITGCAGFIGSNFLDKFLELGHEVVGIDNLSTGQKKYIENSLYNKNFQFIENDLFTSENLASFFEGSEIVFHFAANADVRFGLEDTKRDLNQNIIVTHNVLEAMRENNIKKIVFSSTGSVYGESQIFPTPEDASFPIQTSLYASSKVAAEGLITSYCYGFDMQAWIFRFVSILGPRYSHGHVYDFYQKLLLNEKSLKVLGDGKQRKSYLHIDDCVRAIEIALEKSNEKINIFNLGTDEFCEVVESIEWITNDLGLDPELDFSGGKRGWVGDNPFIFLDNQKIRSLGWKPKHSIKESVLSTLKYLKENRWLFKK